MFVIAGQPSRLPGFLLPFHLTWLLLVLPEYALIADGAAGPFSRLLAPFSGGNVSQCRSL